MRGVGVIAAIVLALSLTVNLLVLASPLYMLQLFDRAVVSGSLETLGLLTVITLFALFIMGGLDWCRSHILARVADLYERRYSGDLLEASIGLSVTAAAQPTTQPLEDLATLRRFIAGRSLASLIDFPWVPVFILVIWLLHESLGLIGVGGALLLFLLALATELLTRRLSERANLAKGGLDRMAETAVANSDVVTALGMAESLSTRWRRRQGEYSESMMRSTARIGALLAISKATRLALQVLILGAGAWLVIERQLTPGQMIAASIIFGRAMAPVETAIGSWRELVVARAAWRRLRRLALHLARHSPGDRLPRPRGEVVVESVGFRPRDDAPLILANLSFRLMAGEVLGIIGPSAAGKSTLARLLVGSWSPSAGSIQLDGAEYHQWERSALGEYIGYLPQDVELIPGSVRENIARFGEVNMEQVIDAAERAGAHSMILGLSDGYRTEVGAGGALLSGGQRQRIALARAVIGRPSLVVLDEPNASLDQEGEQALIDCIDALRAQGTSCVLVAHRRGLLEHCDKLLWLQEGRCIVFGPTAKVVERLQAQSVAAEAGEGA